MFKNDVDEYPYSMGGTCFVVGYKSRAFVVTARHCLRDRNPRESLIPLTVGGRDFIPLNQYGTYVQKDLNDPAYADLAVFETPLDKYPENKSFKLDRFLLDLQIGRSVQPDKGIIMLKGYPYEIKGIDYDRCNISVGPFVSDADYLEPASEYCFWVGFPTESIPIQSINGMSGSPVFQFLPSDYLIRNLIGIVIEGTVKSARVKVIDSRVIITKIESMISH